MLNLTVLIEYFISFIVYKLAKNHCIQVHICNALHFNVNPYCFVDTNDT